MYILLYILYVRQQYDNINEFVTISKLVRNGNGGGAAFSEKRRKRELGVRKWLISCIIVCILVFLGNTGYRVN